MLVPELLLHSQHLRSLSRVLKLVCFVYLVYLV